MGGDQKTTIMVLKVDLQCSSCYKKVKKILCKFPEIRDQVYDEKGNTVTITVVCCDPEKLRDKLCCKGCGVIVSIEIKDKPKPETKPVTKPETKPETKPIQECPQLPHGYCCGQCYEGQTGGPCYQWYGKPVPPPPCYGNYGYSYWPYGYGRGCYVSRCDYYFSDENANACSIM